MSATTNGTDLQAQGRDVYRASVVAGDPLSGAELGRRFRRSPQWGRMVSAQVRAEGNGHEPGDEAPGADMVRQPTADASTEPVGDSAALAPLAVPVWVRWVTTAAVVAVAVSAAVASFDHLATLAALAGDNGRHWLLPVSVDGLVLAASMTLYVASKTQQPAGTVAWAALVLGLGASVVGNIVAVNPDLVDPTGLRVVVAGWPPLALALAFEMALRQVRATR